MLSRIRRVLRAVSGSDPAMGRESLDHRVHVAATALLLEAAYADYECSVSELDHLGETIQDYFGLSTEETEELIKTAQQERDEAVDMWQFTHLINRNFTPREKTGIMEAVWRVIYADGKLEVHEDHFAHKLAQLLHVSHNEMIDAKIRARQAMQPPAEAQPG